VQETQQPMGREDAGARDWWRDAVIYQVYVRSFADGNGDGTGDLAGVRARLGYLRDLGVDAIWFSPWYPSPMADSGYDIADYRSIEPAFGTLAEAELLITEALALGIRTIIDVVPNHVSDQHPWFQAALTEGPGSPSRALFWFRPGRGRAGEEPPTDWVGEQSRADGSRHPAKRLAGEPLHRPLVHRDGVDGLVEANRPLVPVQHPPVEAVVATVEADAREGPQQRGAYSRPASRWPHVQVIEVDAVLA
jgi:hypothetical protein